MRQVCLGLWLIAAMGASGVPAPAAAQTVDTLYRAGVDARTEGRFGEAVTSLRRAVALDPENVDVLVQLGFSELATDNPAAARRAFDAVLARTPDYQDARFGLALIAFRDDDLPRARLLVETVLAATPDAVEPRALVASIDEAEAAQPGKWRLDIGHEDSRLTGRRSSWTDSAVAISYAYSPMTSVAGRLRFARRNGVSDTQIEARLNRALSPRMTAYGLVAIGPDAAFLSQFSLGGGVDAEVIGGSGTSGPLFLTGDLRRDVYAETAIITVMSGFRYYFADEKLALTGRWIHSRDDAGLSSKGYVARIDAFASDRLRFHAGYGDAPEIDGPALVDTRTAFAGLAFDVAADMTLRVDLARERRTAFDRDTLGIGVAIRF